MPESLDLATVRMGHAGQFDNTARLRDINSMEKCWQRLQAKVNPELYPLLRESPRGNPARHRLEVDGQTYTASVSSIEFAAMVSSLLPYLSGSVNEIGGGYGGLAAASLRTSPAITEWTIVDIPDTARVSRWYLEDPRARVVDMADVEQMAPADLVVQTRGFMEMSAPELAFYFDLIQYGKLLKPNGLLWMINRKDKVSSIRNYPFDEKWDVLKSEPWPEGDMQEILLRRTGREMGTVASRLRLRGR
jgi:hypothetical protein